MHQPPKILMVGLFLDKEKNIPTQANELADVLSQNGHQVITTSAVKNKALRLIDTLFYIIKHKNNFDVGIVQVFTGMNFFLAYLASVLIKRFNKKLILIIRGGALPEKMKTRADYYLRLFNKADTIVCPSLFMVKSLEVYNIKTTLIENVIQLHKYPDYAKKNLQPILFWMRALSPIYNPQMAVKVINELKNTYNYKNVKLYLAGPDMGEKKSVLALIAELGLRDNIEIVGFVNMKKKLYFAKECDIYICTNNVDNAPVSFLEMMALGLPIVSTNIGGIPYLVTDHETALLVNAKDYKAMAEKVDYLLNHPDIADRLVNNGRNYIDNFSEKNVLRKWNELFGKLS